MRGLVCLVVVCGCYAPHAAPGAPCSASGECPSGLVCATIGSERSCVVSEPPNDATNPDPSGDAAMARWTLVQTSGAVGEEIDLDDTGADHLIVVAVETDDDEPVTSITDDVHNTYTLVPGSRATNAGEAFAVEIWYAARAKAGASVITVDGTLVYATVAWEVAGITSDTPVRAVATLDDQPASTAPKGAALATTGPGQFIAAAIIVENQVSGMHAGNSFTSDERVFGDGYAHLTNRDATAGLYVPQWDQPTIGVSCASSVAFGNN